MSTPRLLDKKNNGNTMESLRLIPSKLSHYILFQFSLIYSKNHYFEIFRPISNIRHLASCGNIAVRGRKGSWEGADCKEDVGFAQQQVVQQGQLPSLRHSERLHLRQCQPVQCDAHH